MPSMTPERNASRSISHGRIKTVLGKLDSMGRSGDVSRCGVAGAWTERRSRQHHIVLSVVPADAGLDSHIRRAGHSSLWPHERDQTTAQIVKETTMQATRRDALKAGTLIPISVG